MSKNIIALFLAGFVCVVTHGCTYRIWYEGFQEGQRQKCYRSLNQYEIRECLDRVNSMTYDEYKKKREDSSKPSE